VRPKLVGINHVALQVDDLEATEKTESARAQLRAKGLA
jgi:hypothetical protein